MLLISTILMLSMHAVCSKVNDCSYTLTTDNVSVEYVIAVCSMHIGDECTLRSHFVNSKVLMNFMHVTEGTKNLG